MRFFARRVENGCRDHVPGTRIVYKMETGAAHWQRQGSFDRTECLHCLVVLHETATVLDTWEYAYPRKDGVILD